MANEDPPPGTDRASAEFVSAFKTLLEKYGVGTYELVYRNPDNGDCVYMADGEWMWRVGAVASRLSVMYGRDVNRDLTFGKEIE